MKEKELRVKLIETAREMNRLGLNQGTSGNLSVRFGDGMLITPSGMRYEDMQPSDIVEMDARGRSEGARKPSSEWPFHLAVYEDRPEAGAVLHAHPPYATALACHRRQIPAFHYMVAVAGGSDIRCAEYATFGTDELARNVLRALRDRKAVLMANHGMLCFDSDLDRALALAIEVETLAAQYWRALQLGEPPVLSSDEMAIILEKFRDYGTARLSGN